MNRQGFSLLHRGLLLAAMSAALAGCNATNGLPGIGGGNGGAEPAADSSAPGILRIEEREVERPDIYSAKARGLWDGRFSLGGRWVAVEEKVQAERVRITNTDNGRVIEGALFPREFDLPGPPIMVSMDAAIALGMEAGSPANLDVVVLRTETVEIPAPPPPPTPEAPAESAVTAAEPAPAAAPAAAQQGIETGALATTSLAATAAPAGASDAAAPARPRIQVAGGANKAGAEAVVRRLEGVDVAASVSETAGGDGKPFYRVFAGPFATTAELDAALAAIRKLGYADAFPVK